ncbi:MAG: hypothetical protein M1833_004229 [Piccolia ochrophora]|nr:MAG: hypothetical protein M1833_004229 [Piccolia ochrophora]
MVATSKGASLPHLLPPTGYERLVRGWLEEDCPSFDVGGFVVGDADAEAKLLGKTAVAQPRNRSNVVHQV